MTTKGATMGRRDFLAAGAGAMALTGIAHSVSAAEPTAGEQANIQLVNEFCAAWSSHDLDNIMAFFCRRQCIPNDGDDGTGRWQRRRIRTHPNDH